jgi:hypothetical protein
MAKRKIKSNEGRLLAKARDKFFRENPTLLGLGAAGIYLKNRLEKAFISGWDAGKKYEQ